MEHDRPRPTLPSIPAPPSFTERRQAFRRAEDQSVHEERALLARALDVLAGPGDAATQLAEILALVARVVGARRAALVTDRPVRRVLTAAAPGEDPAAARGLAAWLDANSLRPAAVRAAAGPAEIIVVRTRRGRAGVGGSAASDGPLAARAVILGASGSAVELGLEMARAEHRAAASARLPPATLRHLLAALAAASSRAADEDERRDLQARERERERFVAMVAHELRTPLTGLGGYLDLLAEGAVDDPAIGREFIERGRGIVERMASLVGDLLELSRIEAGNLRLETDQISLAEACEQALAPLEPIAARREIHVVSDLPPRLRTVRADRRRVEQVITNLAANACKFAPRGGLVEVIARVEGLAAVVVVRDDGPGIERADLERVFRPFARLEQSERVPGTGLGLPISRDLARAMGGDIEVASVPGSGSSFVLGLPASADVPAASVSSAIEAALEREEVALEERTVLRALRAGARIARSDDMRAPAPRVRAHPGMRAHPGAFAPGTSQATSLEAQVCPHAGGPVRQIVDNPVDNPVDDTRRGSKRSRSASTADPMTGAGGREGPRGDPGRQPDERRETVLPGSGRCEQITGRERRGPHARDPHDARRVPCAIARRSRPTRRSAPRSPTMPSRSSTPAARYWAPVSCRRESGTQSSGTSASCWRGPRRST